MIRKLFNNLNISWIRLIIAAIVIGIYVGLVNSCTFLYDTSFRDIAVTLEWWILFGVIIIMNSKGKLDSALKCFVFFLISQPLIYLVEVPFSNLGFGVFGYYKFWGMVTILTFPMGYFGYYLKQDKPWTLCILIPMIILLGGLGISYASSLYSYTTPHHLLTVLFCLVIPYVLVYGIYKDSLSKKIGYIVCIIVSLVSIGFFIYNVSQGFRTYDITLFHGDELLNENTVVSFEDKKYGDVVVSREDDGTYYLDIKFKKIGKTKLIIANGDIKKEINFTIKNNTYSIDD